MTTMKYAIEAAKKEVSDGFALRYSTEPGQVWLETDQGWFKIYDEVEDDYTIFTRS